ncbi:MAG: hypothetical protein HGA97_01070 [Chlorobiaceae bacterium]|nr:hypothetical protein [Chlorobiaceae bacterium]
MTSSDSITFESGAEPLHIDSKRIHKILRERINKPENLLLLKHWAENDESDGIRMLALKKIADSWRNKLETMEWLKGRAVLDASLKIRLQAIHIVASDWRVEQNDETDKTIIWLKELATVAENEDIRKCAVQAFNSLMPNNPIDLLTVPDPFHGGDNDNERGDDSRVWTLKNVIWRSKFDTVTLHWAMQQAEFDESDRVRLIAVEEVADAWQSNAETLIWLKHRAVVDKNDKIRKAAIEAIAYGWRDEPDTQAWLNARAIEEKSSEIREVLQHELDWGWRELPNAIEYLRHKAEGGKANI